MRAKKLRKKATTKKNILDGGPSFSRMDLISHKEFNGIRVYYISALAVSNVSLPSQRKNTLDRQFQF